LAVVVAAALTACGGGGGFHYVKNARYGAYFKVPSSWGQFSLNDLVHRTYEEDPQKEPSVQGMTAVLQHQWYVGYDGSGKADPDHLPLGGDHPVVRVKARQLLKAERDHFTMDMLRVADLPITLDALDQARSDEQQAAQKEPRAQAVDPTFQTLRDVDLHRRGFRGVHYIFNMRHDSSSVALQTYDVVGWVNEALTVEYFMVMTCLNPCFTAYQSEFATVTSSFTVREH
jgi:hypothetical protein